MLCRQTLLLKAFSNGQGEGQRFATSSPGTSYDMTSLINRVESFDLNGEQVRNAIGLQRSDGHIANWVVCEPSFRRNSLLGCQSLFTSVHRTCTHALGRCCLH